MHAVLSPKRLIVSLLSIYLSIYLSGSDTTCVANPLPHPPESLGQLHWGLWPWRGAHTAPTLHEVRGTIVASRNQVRRPWPKRPLALRQRTWARVTATPPKRPAPRRNTASVERASVIALSDAGQIKRRPRLLPQCCVRVSSPRVQPHGRPPRDVSRRRKGARSARVAAG